MSTESYSKWWIVTKKNLEKVKSYDDELKRLPVIKDRNLANELIGGLYARYCLVVQELDTCLDQMCQIQKSFTIRKLMDAATARLNELKDEMLKIDLSEYHYVDGSLIELKIVPHSIEVLHPKLKYPRPEEFEQLWSRVKKGEIIYTPPSTTSLVIIEEKGKKKPGKRPKIDPLALLQKSEAKKSKVAFADEMKENEDTPKIEEEKTEAVVEAPTSKKHKKAKVKKVYVMEVPQLTEEEIEAQLKKVKLTEAVILIQIHERARQSRLYYNDIMSDINASKKAADPRIPKPAPADQATKEKSAVTIQSAWKGYGNRNVMKQREDKRRLVIGMAQKSYISQEEKIKFQRNLEARRAIREEKLREYFKETSSEEARVLRVIGPGLFEDIGDELRVWMRNWYDKGNAFQEFPTENLGGSVLIVRGEVQSVEEYLADLKNKSKKKPKEKTKEQLQKEEKEKKDKQLKEKAQKQKEAAQLKKAALNGDIEVKIGDTVAHNKFLEGFKEYKDLWEEVNDPDNSIHMNLITEEKCYHLQLKIRKEVDTLMRLEMNILLAALEKDKWIAKGSKGKFKPKKVKKGKKEKKPRAKKDPTGHRKPEDLLQELIDNGIVRKYPEARLCDYFGDFSYQNWERRILEFDPPATLGDVKQAVALNCILPLGVGELQKPKSVLIVGHKKSGKHLLANAIFNETNCVLFDLSPSVLAGKYPGKKGNASLVHLVSKMSRLLQPSIIFIDQVEKTFYKKVPKEEKDLEPKKAGKFLFKKIIKPLKPADKVLVLGISGEPWAATAANLKKTFQRVILIPRSDYGTIFQYWQNLLMQYHGVDRNFDVSSLAKLTQYYPLSELRNAVLSTLVPRRIIQLNYKPLHQSELLSYLLQGEGPIDDKEYTKFIKWYNKTTVGKQRAKLNALAAEMREKLNKKKQK